MNIKVIILSEESWTRKANTTCSLYLQILTRNVCRCIHVGVSVGIGHATRKWGKGIKEWGNGERIHVTK